MQTLEQWLDVAARGLCESAAERVRAEIREHYQSAVESAAAAGLDLRDAERHAVAALGDAKTANREYRRVLLTESEANLLGEMTSIGPHHVIGLLLLAALTIYAISVRTSEFNYVFGAALFIWGTQHLPIRSIRAGWVVRVLRWAVHVAFFTMWFMSVHRVSPSAFEKQPMATFLGVSMLLLPLAMAHTEYRLFVIRRKLPVEQWPRRLWV